MNKISLSGLNCREPRARKQISTKEHRSRATPDDAREELAVPIGPSVQIRGEEAGGQGQSLPLLLCSESYSHLILFVSKRECPTWNRNRRPLVRFASEGWESLSAPRNRLACWTRKAPRTCPTRSPWSSRLSASPFDSRLESLYATAGASPAVGEPMTLTITRTKPSAGPFLITYSSTNQSTQLGGLLLAHCHFQPM